MGSGRGGAGGRFGGTGGEAGIGDSGIGGLSEAGVGGEAGDNRSGASGNAGLSGAGGAIGGTAGATEEPRAGAGGIAAGGKGGGVSGEGGDGGGAGGTSTDPCVPSPCVHGSCEANGDSSVCNCGTAYLGPACEYDANECGSGNGGCDLRTTCTNDFGGYHCGPCPFTHIGSGETGCEPVGCALGTDCETALGTAPFGRQWSCNGGVCDLELEDCGACYSGPNGTLGVGVCQSGEVDCTGVHRCLGERTPSGEACNGFDDDCNGVVDDLPSVTCGVGACAVTVSACANGAVQACVPGAPLAQTDGCDGIDADCDGAIDEECSPCVRVAPNGNDAAAAVDPTAAAFRNVQPAIDFAAAHPSFSTRVCVAAGATCGATATYPGPAGSDLTMRDGISLLGNYESTSFTRCSSSTTRLAPTTAAGVLFSSEIDSATVLDGFAVDRASFTTTAAVTVKDARSVVLSNLSITNAPAVERSYGVNVVDGGEALIFRSRIEGGLGSVESIGVRAVGGLVAIEDACPGAVNSTTGRCDSSCNWSWQGPARPGSSVWGGAKGSGGASYAVLLDDSPGSRLERSAFCVGDATFLHDPDDDAFVAAVRVQGDARGVTIRASSLETSGIYPGYYHRGRTLWMQDCTAGEPRVADNEVISASFTDTSGPRVLAVEALGECHAVLDSNQTISVAGDGWSTEATAVSCAAQGGVGSRCVIEGNPEIYAVQQGSSLQSRAKGIGVSCGEGSCARIVENHLSGNRSFGQNFRDSIPTHDGTGLVLDRAGPFVDRNVIEGGCTLGGTSIGIVATDGFARLQNNEIVGSAGGCPSYHFPGELCNRTTSAVGLSVIGARGQNELDVHSNLITPGKGVGCIRITGAGVLLQISENAPPDGPSGVFRNNYLTGLADSLSIVFEEASADADPRIFAHNSLDTRADPTEGFVYWERDRGGDWFANDVNLFADSATLGNIDGCAHQGTYPPLVLAVPTLPNQPSCIDAGTIVGAPAYDVSGARRDAAPDIGPREF